MPVDAERAIPWVAADELHANSNRLQHGPGWDIRLGGSPAFRRRRKRVDRAGTSNRLSCGACGVARIPATFSPFTPDQQRQFVRRLTSSRTNLALPVALRMANGDLSFHEVRGSL